MNDNRTRMFPRRAGLVLALFALLLSACGSGGAEGTGTGAEASGAELSGSAAEPEYGGAFSAPEKRLVRLGGSLYAVELADGFLPSTVTDRDWEDDMAASYTNAVLFLDMAVYYFPKEGYPDTLEEFIEEESLEYDAEEVVTDAMFNGIPAAYYRAKDLHGGVYRDGITCAIEDGDNYMEVDFWFSGPGAEAHAFEMMNTLTVLDTVPLSLGEHSVRIPPDFTPVEPDAGPAVYRSGSTELVLRVSTGLGPGEELAALTRLEAAAHGGTDVTIDEERSGVPVGSYRTIQGEGGEFHNYLTYIVPDGGQFTALSFQLDGITAEREAEDILNTLS